MKKNDGLSLVELLVALLLASIIAAAGIQLLLTNSKMYRLQNGMSEVQEGGRFAIEYLIRDIRMAGYTSSNSTCNASESPVRFGSGESSEGSGNDNDVLELRRCAASDTDTNCLGSSEDIAKDTSVISRYYVNNNNLYCMDKTADKNTIGLLVSGVDSFQVRYGTHAQEDSTNQYYAQDYKKADAVDTSAENVTAIQLGLLIASNDMVLDKFTAGSDAELKKFEQQYQLFDQTITVDDGDGLLRRKFVTTVELRNSPRKLPNL